MNEAISGGDATPFPELNGLLEEFTDRVQSILADNLVGAYVVGSFALGAGDLAGARAAVAGPDHAGACGPAGSLE